MFEDLDGERASSAVVAVVALALLAALVLESTGVAPGAGRLAGAVGGGVYVCYAAGATGYLLLPEEGERAA